MPILVSGFYAGRPGEMPSWERAVCPFEPSSDSRWLTLNAAVLATVLVGALRNARRRSVDLAEQCGLANEALCGFADDGDFVTGQVVRIENTSGTARM